MAVVGAAVEDVGDGVDHDHADEVRREAFAAVLAFVELGEERGAVLLVRPVHEDEVVDVVGRAMGSRCLLRIRVLECRDVVGRTGADLSPVQVVRVVVPRAHVREQGRHAPRMVALLALHDEDGAVAFEDAGRSLDRRHLVAFHVDLDEVRAQLKQIPPDRKWHKAIKDMLAGKSFATPGNRDETLQALCSTIAWLPPGRKGDPKQLAEIFRPSLTVWASEEREDGKEHVLEDDLERAADKIERYTGFAQGAEGDGFGDDLLHAGGFALRDLFGEGVAVGGVHLNRVARQFRDLGANMIRIFFYKIIEERTRHLGVMLNGEDPVADGKPGDRTSRALENSLCTLWQVRDLFDVRAV